MSVRLMADVWEYSKHESTTLLLLLALADFANDDGICWPKIERLAKKCRLSDRQTQRLIKSLIECGDVSILDNRSGRGNNLIYKVHAESIKGDITMSPLPKIKGDIQGVKGDIQGAKNAKRVTSRAVKGDIQGQKSAVNPLESKGNKPDPSHNHQEDKENHHNHHMHSASPPADDEQSKVENLAVKEDTEITKHTKPLSAFQRLMMALAETRNLNMKINQWGRLAKEVKPYADMGATPDDFAKFRQWWFEVGPGNFHGKPPSMPQINEHWQTAMDFYALAIPSPECTDLVIASKPTVNNSKALNNKSTQTLAVVDSVFDQIRKSRK